MSVDAVTYSRAEWLAMTYGFVVRIGETLTGKGFSDRILSVFDRDLAHAKCAACDARKNVVSITRKLGDLYDVKWRESKNHLKG